MCIRDRSYSAAEVESETTMDSIVQSEQGTSQTENESDKSVAVTAEGNANVLVSYLKLNLYTC